MTYGATIATLFWTDLRDFQRRNMWIFWLFFGVTLFSLVIVSVFKNLGRIVPINYLFFLIVTCGMIYMAAAIASFSD